VLRDESLPILDARSAVLSGAADFAGTRVWCAESGIVWPSGGLPHGGDGLPGPDLRPGLGQLLTAVLSARHTSVMSITPRRPTAPATGRRRRSLAVMMVAASRMLVVVVTAGRVIVTAWTWTSLRSFPFAIAWAMSAWVMMPGRRFARP